MNLLVIYGTTEGQTLKIANFIADRLCDRGETVTLIDSADTPTDLDVDGFDAVIAAGSVHNGRHQASLFQFVRDRREALQTKPSAFISVSLSMASDKKEDWLDAAACADRFFEAAEWKPTVIHLVAGAIRYSQYDFFKSWILKMIASTKGASTDTSQDHEFTDWKDLEAFVDAFLTEVAEHSELTIETPEKHAFVAEKPELFARITILQSAEPHGSPLSKDRPMAQKSIAEISKSTDWQEAYITTAAALGASWCDFVGERFHAYAHALDDVAHCHDLNEAWKVQANFGQQTFKAYSDQAAKVSGLMMDAAKGNGGSTKH